jgi:hypothetical protein
VPRGNVLLAALCLSAVAACSDPKAGTLPTASPTPSTTAPTASPASASSSPNDFGIGQAVTDYYDALEAAVHDPSANLARLEAMLDPACACREILDVLREEARRGRHADYTLEIATLTVPDKTPERGIARLTVVQSAGNLYDASGRVVERIKPTTDAYFVEVRSNGGRWRVARVTAQ